MLPQRDIRGLLTALLLQLVETLIVAGAFFFTYTESAMMG